MEFDIKDGDKVPFLPCSRRVSPRPPESGLTHANGGDTRI